MERDGNVGLGINSRFNNNGTFDAATDTDFVPTGGGMQGFFNAGSFTKFAGAAAT